MSAFPNFRVFCFVKFQTNAARPASVFSAVKVENEQENAVLDDRRTTM